tara:strand:+ start:836 stop:1198 length:363 start_codon:yes stop_codon:yes gene_type:complete
VKSNLYKKVLILFLFFLLLSLKLYGNERYICKRQDTNEIINFYISENKLYLSGLSISGTYSLLNKSNNGVLAINMSKIGNETGIEIIFLDLENNVFSVKSNIFNNSNSSLIQIKGNCNID